MTFKERLMQESKERLVELLFRNSFPCPADLDYEEGNPYCARYSCLECWNREMPEESNHGTHD